MNILFTLCGRAGSKGVKGKNARDFLNVPLVWYSMAGMSLYLQKYGKKNDHIDIVLNTDSEDLIQLVNKVKDFDVTVLRRTSELSGDRVAKVSVMLDCLNRAEEIFKIKYDMVVDLDITSPLRTVQDIRNIIERKALRSDVDSVYSVCPSRKNPYFNMVKEENGFYCKVIPSNYISRQQVPPMYDMNASIYAYNPKALREKDHATFFNDRCDATIMMDTGILDIDSEEDYELMQVIAQYLFDYKEGFGEIYRLAKSWVK